MSEHSRPYRWLRGHLGDAYAEAGFGFGHTFPLRVRLAGWRRWPLPLTRLDYVFHTAHLRVAEARLLEPIGSDHRSLLVAFLR
jgi:endonuclease/exonuclease/phosphatase (EEP) superfamily protein YafD